MKIQNNSQEKLIRKIFHEYVGGGRIDLFDDFFSNQLLVHAPESWRHIHGMDSLGPENVKKIDQVISKAFEMTKVHIEEQLSNQSKSSVIWSFEGVHREDFFGIPPKNSAISITGQTFFSFDQHNVITEVWQSWDMYGLLRQISTESLYPFLFSNSAERSLQLLQPLSKREKECILYLLQGKTAKETALALDLSYRTIEYYFENIKKKLGCSNKREIYSIFQFMKARPTDCKSHN